ncbi:MAG: TetR/AcrR family transcriptional regulator [Porticoccaceae bacterium]|nr:TetR/AcrR family transcriptional regulator [Pseudomonadales bacterium]MCP5172170.1 TetR/AcrR family transcriptional regulator [Pseudomonadales bacterium]
MPTKNPDNTRRRPKQSRSINTVESILQAAEELFLKQGFDSATVEQIAKRAGVGIGSIYDYFPNKISIALALLESVSAMIANDSKTYFIEFGRESIEESMPKVIRKVFGSYKRHKNIVITLVESAPELRLAAELYSVEKLIYRASLIYLQIYEDNFAGKNLNTAHALLNQVFAASIKQYLSDENPQLSEEEFLQELSNMFLAYIIKP